MKHRLYCIRDKYTGFAQPTIFANDNVAVRYFKDLCLNAGNVITNNPADFDLYHIGNFDEETGELDSIMPVFIVAGNSFAVKE